LALVAALLEETRFRSVSVVWGHTPLNATQQIALEQQRTGYGRWFSRTTTRVSFWNSRQQTIAASGQLTPFLESDGDSWTICSDPSSRGPLTAARVATAMQQAGANPNDPHFLTTAAELAYQLPRIPPNVQNGIDLGIIGYSAQSVSGSGTAGSELAPVRLALVAAWGLCWWWGDRWIRRRDDDA
jgi:hypothetical protein